MFIKVAYWWIIVFLFGIVNLPLTFWVFKRFYDRGYIFSRILAFAIFSYLVWLLAILKLIPFNFFSIFLSGGLLLFLNTAIAKSQKLDKIRQTIKKKWKTFALEELLFFSGFYFWSWIRSFQPDILGLEKYMDFGFVNSILRSRFFPPNDMWLAGESINYYYFGHFQTALLTRLSQTPSPITYNLMLGLICGLTLAASYSITSNLVHWGLKKKVKNRQVLIFSTGILSALMLTFGGNLQILYHLFTKGTFKNYWYPDATRFIIEKFGAADNTIHEFPMYSFVVSDLHGHLLDLPQALLIIALLFSFFKSGFVYPKINWLPRIKKFLTKMIKKLTPSSKEKEEEPFLAEIKTAFQESLYKVPVLTILAFMLAVAFMTNAWDYPVYLLFGGMVFLLFNYLKQKTPEKALIRTFFNCFFLVAISLVFNLPFHLNFQNIAEGVAVVDFHSPPWMLLFLWGFPLFTSLSFLLILKKQEKIKTHSDYFVLSLIVVCWILIFIPEVLRVKDIYTHTHQRANTMFKLTYQAFVVFRLLNGYFLIKILTDLKGQFLKRILLLIFLAGTTTIMLYPQISINSYYNGLKTQRGLDGIKYLKNLYPDDYQAILWLRQEIKGDPVILESVGESYTNHARVSANTGLPTILGWRVHEWLWRGTFDISGKRTEEVKTIYTSKSKQQVESLLDKYRVKYIFIGSLEKETYPNLNEELIKSLGKAVFSSGETKIYKYD